MNNNEGFICCTVCRNTSGCKSSAHDYGHGKKINLNISILSLIINMSLYHLVFQNPYTYINNINR